MERLTFSYGKKGMNFGLEGNFNSSFISPQNTQNHHNTMYQNLNNAYQVQPEFNDGLRSFEFSLGLSPYGPRSTNDPSKVKPEYNMAHHPNTLRNAFSSSSEQTSCSANAQETPIDESNNSYEMFKVFDNFESYNSGEIKSRYNHQNLAAIKSEQNAYSHPDTSQISPVHKSAFVDPSIPQEDVPHFSSVFRQQQQQHPNYFGHHLSHHGYNSMSFEPDKEAETLNEKMNSLTVHTSPLHLVRRVKPEIDDSMYTNGRAKPRKLAGDATPGPLCSAAQPVGSFGIVGEHLMFSSSPQDLDLSGGQRRRWTQHEDNLLKQAVNINGEKNWKAIADLVEGRNHVQCLQRWKKVLKPGLIKGHWTEEEDALLTEAVSENYRNWGDVAQKIKGRTAKQCRERWTCNLDPNINREKWTEEEDAKIIEAQKQLGNKWSTIANMLPGRTENAIKTRAKSLQRREQKKWTIEEDDLIISFKTTMKKKQEGDEHNMTEAEIGITRSSAWAKIASQLPGRSKNAVKKRWKELKEERFADAKA